MSRYGHEGAAVSAFLAEVAQQDIATWQALSDGPLDSTEQMVDAADAITRLPLSAPVRTAVTSDAARAYVDLALDPADFPGLFRLGNVRDGIESAAVALAAGDSLDRVHRETLLRPFADAGFASAQAALADLG
ncbi:hypothetical protein [Cellulomonas sp. NPDC089187]|uniref:hypothetical protein n=1 Tax=Cellulomonas sp. NPDC089187 TaxID=3154970 RepID=UPI003444ABFB